MTGPNRCRLLSGLRCAVDKKLLSTKTAMRRTHMPGRTCARTHAHGGKKDGAYMVLGNASARFWWFVVGIHGAPGVPGSFQASWVPSSIPQRLTPRTANIPPPPDHWGESGSTPLSSCIVGVEKRCRRPSPAISPLGVFLLLIQAREPNQRFESAVQVQFKS